MLEIIPYGRLGNNILQIFKCIIENIYHYNHAEINLKLLKEKNELLNNCPDYLIFNFKNNNENIKDTFWNITTNVYNISLDVQINIINTYIKPYIDYKLNQYKEINFDNDLIIHIRSGDIFDKKFDFNVYKQPPYSFYKRIIEENNFEYIYIISENININPVISKILNNFKNVRFISNDLKIDFKIMLNAKYFVSSNSTLSLVINSLSLDKKIYISQGWAKGFHNFETIFIDSSKYYSLENKTYDEKIINLLDN